MMEEITLTEWLSDAGAGMFGTPRFEQLHAAATEGKLIVIDSNGNRLVPTASTMGWELKPLEDAATETTIETKDINKTEDEEEE